MCKLANEKKVLGGGTHNSQFTMHNAQCTMHNLSNLPNHSNPATI